MSVDNASMNTRVKDVSLYRWKWWIHSFSRHRLARLGLSGLALIGVSSLLGPGLLDPAMQQMNLDRMYEAPSLAHPFGTDQLGRDLLYRILEAGRTSLWIGLVATMMATSIGCAYGLASAMSPVWLDRILMRMLDTALALPVLLLVIVFQAFGDSSLLKIILTIGLSSWMGIARMVRIESRRLLQATFIKAAVASGSSHLRIAFKHLLPNILGPLIVVVTVGVGQAILLETTLSFLNLGVPPTLPSWGNLLGNGMSAVLGGAWWSILFPGLMIVLTVLCINLIGDGLGDIVDPKHRSMC